MKFAQVRLKSIFLEDLDIGRFNIDQNSHPVQSNGIDKTNRLSTQDCRVGEETRATACGFSKTQTAVSSAALPTALQ